jgi:hypothetical protein
MNPCETPESIASTWTLGRSCPVLNRKTGKMRDLQWKFFRFSACSVSEQVSLKHFHWWSRAWVPHPRSAFVVAAGGHKIRLTETLKML